MMLVRLAVLVWLVVPPAIAVKCKKGFTSCNGECVNLQTDANHCGKCGMSCAVFQLNCIDGHCEHASKDCAKYGEIKCDGYCWDPKISPHHCGSCGNYCTSNQSCQNGICSENTQTCGSAYSTCENSVYCGEGFCGSCKRSSKGINTCVGACQIFGDCTDDAECTKQPGGICTHDTCRAAEHNRGTCCYPDTGCSNAMRARTLFDRITN